MRITRRSLVACAVALALPAVASAQATAPASPVLPRFSIATNPVVIPFGLFSFEYEGALRIPGMTLGVGGSHWSRDEDRDTWAEAKTMYYPQETPFRAFAVGLTAGVHSSRRDRYSCDAVIYNPANPYGECGSKRRRQTSPTLGVMVTYDWLLGRTERFRVGLGGGAKRILKDVKSGDPLEQVWPDGRFLIGFVF